MWVSLLNDMSVIFDNQPAKIAYKWLADARNIIIITFLSHKRTHVCAAPKSSTLLSPGNKVT